MIHKTSIVDSKAKVSSSAKIGPFCVIGPDVEIKEIDKQIKQEIEDGVIMDPMAMQALEMGIGEEDPMAAEGGLPAEGAATDPKSVVDPADQRKGEF